MISNAIILGNHIQGLGVARICKDLGLRVTLFNEENLCVTRFSNSLSHFIKFSGEADLLAKLQQLDVSPHTSVLMPTNDRFVGFMANHYHVLNTKFRLSIPEPDITDICFNKIKTYTTAQQLGIAIPDSYFPGSLAEMQELSNKIQYPVIIKPAVMYRFYGKLGKKVFLCRNPKELISCYQAALQVIIPEEIIVQEFLTGGATRLYSFGSFCSGKKVWGSFVANRIRQKPMDFGISTTFARTVVNPRIHELATKFLTGINYFGLSEVEFMYDEKTDDYKLIEINPRTWKWHTISNKVGINLIEMLINCLNEKPLQEQHNKESNIAWMERITDTYVVLNEVLKGRLNYQDYQTSLRYKKEYACFSWKDPLPGIMYVLLSPYLILTR